MKDLISSLKIYAVTDRYWLNGKELADDVEKAILGGATMIQLREKDLDLNSFVAEALKIKEVCKKYDIPFIINDSLEVFLAVDADGIHVGQNDMRADLVREKIGKNKILGVSAETVEEAILAEKMGADYLGVGTIFNTSTKLDAITVSKETLTNICFAVDIPVVAIGGITKDNIKELKDTFIDGISIVSAIFAEKDIISATKKLNYEVDKILFNPQKYNYFIIDYDGTLLNSLDMWADIASRYIKSKGLTPEVDLDLIVKKQTNAETAAYMKEKYFNNLEVDEVAKDIDSFIAKEYLSIKIYEGVTEFLDLLKNNGKLVLFTATSYPLIEASLKNNNIFNYFEEFYTSTNFDYSKTDGTGFELLKEQNNLDLEKTLVIEDALHALVGAKLKGFNVLGIKTKKNIKDYDTIRKSCDYYIDIRKWIK